MMERGGIMTWPFRNSTRRHVAIVISDNIANYLTFHGHDAYWLHERTRSDGFPQPVALEMINRILSGQPVDRETLARAGMALPLPTNSHLAMNPKTFLRKLEEDKLCKLARTVSAESKER